MGRNLGPAPHAWYGSDVVGEPRGDGFGSLAFLSQAELAGPAQAAKARVSINALSFPGDAIKQAKPRSAKSQSVTASCDIARRLERRLTKTLKR